MSIYFILLFILLLIQGNLIKNKRLYLIFAYLDLLFISGLRAPDGQGSDTYFYCQNFITLNNEKLSDLLNFNFESGFSLFCHLLSYVSKDPQILLFVSSAIMNFSAIYFISKYSKDCRFSVILYLLLMFFFNNMNLMRFGLAIAILLFSVDSVIKRKFLKFSLIVILASFFHFSALFYFIIYFLYPLQLNKKNILLISLPFVVLSYAFQYFFSILISVNPRYTGYDLGDGEFYKSSLANIMIFVNYVIFLIYSVVAMPCKIKDLRGIDKFGFVSGYVAVIMALMAINVMMITRFVTMFGIANIVYIPNITKITRNRSNAYICKHLIIWYALVRAAVILIYRPDWYMINPYSNIVFNISLI